MQSPQIVSKSLTQMPSGHGKKGYLVFGVEFRGEPVPKKGEKGTTGQQSWHSRGSAATASKPGGHSANFLSEDSEAPENATHGFWWLCFIYLVFVLGLFCRDLFWATYLVWTMWLCADAGRIHKRGEAAASVDRQLPNQGPCFSKNHDPGFSPDFLMGAIKKKWCGRSPPKGMINKPRHAPC